MLTVMSLSTCIWTWKKTKHFHILKAQFTLINVSLESQTSDTKIFLHLTWARFLVLIQNISHSTTADVRVTTVYTNMLAIMSNGTWPSTWKETHPQKPDMLYLGMHLKLGLSVLHEHDFWSAFNTYPSWHKPDIPDGLSHKTIWEVTLRNCLEKGRHFRKILGRWLMETCVYHCLSQVDSNQSDLQ